jgi:Ca2+-binding EF-hand superfamily protein
MKRLHAALSAALLCAGQSLPADDAAPKPEALFSQLDKDSNGQLAKDEVPENQVRFFERLARVGDKDEDGELSKDEFVAAMNTPEIQSRQQPGGEGRPGGGPGGRPGMNPEEMFSQMDRNGDGKITRDEIPERAADRLNPIFDRLGKSELTRDELRQAMERAGGGAPGGRPGMDRRFGEEMVARLRNLDANKDGKVTLEEAPEGEARQRVQQIMDRTGRDAVDLEQFARMIAEREGGDRPRPEGAPEGGPRPEMRDGDRPRPEGEPGDRPRPEGDRPRPEGDRPRPEGGFGDRPGPRPEGADGDRPRPEFRDGDRPRPEGDRPRPDGDRPEGDRPRPEGDRPRPEGDRPMGREGEGFRPGGFGPPIFGVLDGNRDGRITREEFESLAKKFGELDRNGDGHLDRAEILGFPPGGPMPRDGEGPRNFGPRDGEGFRPREGEGQPRDGFRPPMDGAGRPRDGEGRPPEGARPQRDGEDRPRPEGDRDDERRPERDDDTKV